jgi:hypothetical protein
LLSILRLFVCKIMDDLEAAFQMGVLLGLSRGRDAPAPHAQTQLDDVAGILFVRRKKQVQVETGQTLDTTGQTIKEVDWLQGHIDYEVAEKMLGMQRNKATLMSTGDVLDVDLSNACSVQQASDAIGKHLGRPNITVKLVTPEGVHLQPNSVLPNDVQVILCSTTELSLAEAKTHFATAAGVARCKAVKAVNDAIVMCQRESAWTHMDEAVRLLEHAGRFLVPEEPSNTHPAAQASDCCCDALLLEDCPTDIPAVLKAVARAVRDVLVLRCCWWDHRSKDAFLAEIAKAYQRQITQNLESQVLHAYNTLTDKHGYDVPDAFISRNQLHRVRRPRRNGSQVGFIGNIGAHGGGAEGFIEFPTSGAASSGTFE